MNALKPIIVICIYTQKDIQQNTINTIFGLRVREPCNASSMHQKEYFKKPGSIILWM